MVALAGAFRRLDADAGRDRAFCSGIDLTTAEDVFKGDVKDPAADPVAAMAACRKPIVGAVAGFAVTAGFEIALACDLLVAGGDANRPILADPCAAEAACSFAERLVAFACVEGFFSGSCEPSSGSRSVASCPGSPSPTSSSPATRASTVTSPASSTPSSAPRRRDPRTLDEILSAADADPFNSKLFVHGLGWETTSEGLRAAFARYGEIEDCRVGFVQFRHRSSASDALCEPQRLIDNCMTACQLASTKLTPALNQLVTAHQVFDLWPQRAVASVQAVALKAEHAELLAAGTFVDVCQDSFDEFLDVDGSHLANVQQARQ
uniref:RRM domain-containing protein n=1 Tax=Ananas comosus var. bracteatus TaxID=296719 RepID=A0A6V7PGR8_ANACO|nr:unnamed protein product [Ananas comosus var. bracteatus]